MPTTRRHASMIGQRCRVGLAAARDLGTAGSDRCGDGVATSSGALLRSTGRALRTTNGCRIDV